MLNFKIIKKDNALTVGYVFKTGVLLDQIKEELKSKKAKELIATEMAEETLSQLYGKINKSALDKLLRLKQMANGGGLDTPARILQSNKLINELIEIMSGSQELHKLKQRILQVL